MSTVIKFVRSIALVATLFVGSVTAQASEIAVMNFKKVFNDNVVSLDKQNKLKGSRDKVQSELTEIEKALDKQDKDLKAKRALLSDEKYKEARKKLTVDYRDYRKKVSDYNKKISSELNNHNREIDTVIRNEVSAYAKEKGYAVVLRQALVLDAQGATDITGAILERVNKRLK